MVIYATELGKNILEERITQADATRKDPSTAGLSLKDERHVDSDNFDALTTMRVIELQLANYDAKKIAERFRSLTGKPLGITGEIGEFAAADKLNLTLSQARQPGYDAIS